MPPASVIAWRRIEKCPRRTSCGGLGRQALGELGGGDDVGEQHGGGCWLDHGGSLGDLAEMLECWDAREEEVLAAACVHESGESAAA